MLGRIKVEKFLLKIWFRGKYIGFGYEGNDLVFIGYFYSYMVRVFLKVSYLDFRGL